MHHITTMKLVNNFMSCHMFLTGHSQLIICERKLIGTELVLGQFVKVDFRTFKTCAGVYATAHI